MENPYAKTPLKVVLLDARTGEALRTFVLLGAAPRAVAEAARRQGKPGRMHSERAPAVDTSMLQSYFGEEWRGIIALGEAPDKAAALVDTDAAPQIVGGGEFGDLEDFNHIDDIPAENDAAAAPADDARPQGDEDRGGPLVYSDVAVFPEDTIWDLRLKIHVACGVPPYRQHLRYTTGDGQLRLPYRMALEGASVTPDIRTLFEAGATQTRVAGVPVLTRFEEQKDSLTAEALDTFTRLVLSPGVAVTAAYVVDLYGVLPPAWAGSAQWRAELAAVLQDRYQFDLLYYGAVVRFWPQLSADALQLALTSASALAGQYPLLSPDIGALRQRLALERGIAARAHAYRFPRDPRARPGIAVTASEVIVSPEGLQTRVSARNVFDSVPTSASVLASVARFDTTDPDSGVTASVAASRRHASSYMPRVAGAVGRFAARPPRRPAVSFAALRAGEAERGRGADLIATVTLAEDARYTAASAWREDDRVSFEQARQDLSRAAAPLVGAVNAMGPAALPFGGRLQEISESRTAAFGQLTVSTFWPHAVTTDGFRQIKSRWRDYERAGVVGIKGLQQAGAYVIQFRKGIVGYDPAAIERVAIRRTAGVRLAAAAGPAVAEEAISVANRYAYLTDTSVLARWQALYGGRTVRIFHRATDLRVEVVKAEGMEEFEIIRRYLFSFLDGLLHGPARVPGLEWASSAGPRSQEAAAADESESIRGPATRRLRRLQERDPNLFDLKKYDPNATVYSVLCQADRQPHVYDAAEAAALPARRRDALVKYWNFTENRPAFYECPSARFPFLSFRAGLHPLGWCLVCCKKTRPVPGTRAALTNEECLRARKRVSAPDEDAASRHVLSYGKVVPVGRAGEIAPSVASGVLNDAFGGAGGPAPFALKLVGVPQSAPAVPDAGFVYAAAAAVAADGETLDDVVGNLAAACQGLGAAFGALGGGAAASFATAEDLAGSLVRAFAERSPDLSPFGPGGAASGALARIVRDLVRLAYGVEVVAFVDTAGKDDVTIEAPPETVEAFFSGEPLRVALICVVGGSGTYPVFGMDPRAFLRTTQAERQAQARRTFEGAATGGAERCEGLSPLTSFGGAGHGGRSHHGSARDHHREPAADHVVSLLREVLALANPAPAPVLDLRTLVAACDASRKYKVAEKLANLHGRVYGAVVQPSEGGPPREAPLPAGEPFFFPTRESPCSADGLPVRFGARTTALGAASVLEAFVAMLNAYARKIGGPSAAESFAPIATLAGPSGEPSGFALGDPSGSFLMCYHRPGAGAAPSGLPVLAAPYDPREVDAAIVAARGGLSSAAGPLSDEAAASSYTSRLYRLFVAEFAAAQRTETNAPLRARLEAAVRDTKFGSPASVAKLRGALAEALKGHPDDLRAVWAIINRELVLTGAATPSESINLAVAASVFAFDFVTLRELRARPHAEIAAAVRRIVGPRIEVRGESENTVGDSLAPDNIFTACSVDSSVSRPQCFGGKLVVPAGRLDALVDILASDIADPRKAVALTQAAGVFDEQALVERPGETLRIIESPLIIA